MNHIVNISFVAASIAELGQALDLLKAAGVAPVASIVPPAAPPDKRGPNEAAYNTLGRRIRFTTQMESEHGTREAYVATLLRELGQPVPSDSLTVSESSSVEWSAPEEKGETYTPAAIPEPEDLSAEDY
jgi:hypothetical protein